MEGNAKTLLFILPDLRPGGAQRVTLNYANTLSSSTNCNVFLCIIDAFGPLRKEIGNDVKIIDLHCTRTRNSFLLLYNVLLSVGPDYCFSSLNRTNILVLLLSLMPRINMKCIIREPNMPRKNTEYSRVNLFLSRILYPRAENIIAQHPLMKDELVDMLKVEVNKVQVVFNPLDISRLDIVNTDCRNPFEKNNKIKNIVYVGRISHQKGVDKLIKAFSIANPDLLNKTILHIVGDGENIEECKDLCRLLDVDKNVKFHGHIDNPTSYMYFSDSVILTSRWEGFPNVLLEAIYLGIPVISTNTTPFLSEIIERNSIGVICGFAINDIVAAIVKGQYMQKYDGFLAVKSDIRSVFE
jgi:glycosyltransferase involved in cell wall biosynthesis